MINLDVIGVRNESPTSFEMLTMLPQHYYNGESTSKMFHVHSQHDFHSNKSQNKVEKRFYSFKDILFAHSSFN